LTRLPPPPPPTPFSWPLQECKLFDMPEPNLPLQAGRQTQSERSGQSGLDTTRSESSHSKVDLAGSGKPPPEVGEGSKQGASQQPAGAQQREEVPAGGPLEGRDAHAEGGGPHPEDAGSGGLMQTYGGTAQPPGEWGGAKQVDSLFRLVSKHLLDCWLLHDRYVLRGGWAPSLSKVPKGSVLLLRRHGERVVHSSSIITGVWWVKHCC